MHALEKSDCAVVLVKQPNNGGQPFTDAVEGRTQAKDRGYSPDYNVRVCERMRHKKCRKRKTTKPVGLTITRISSQLIGAALALFAFTAMAQTAREVLGPPPLCHSQRSSLPQR